MKTVFFLDVSTSTQESPEYRTFATSILNKLVQAGDEVTPITWSHVVNRKVTVESILAAEAPLVGGGTSVIPLLDNLLQRGDTYDKVVVVSDGQVGPSMLHYAKHLSKRKCLPWDFAEVHIVLSPDGGQDAMMCVAAPFVFGTRHVVYAHDAKDTRIVSQCDRSRDDVLRMFAGVEKPSDLDACFADVCARVRADALLQADVYSVALLGVKRRLVDDGNLLMSTPNDEEQCLFNKVQSMEYNAWKFYNDLSLRTKDALAVLQSANDCEYGVASFGAATSALPARNPVYVRDLFEVNHVTSEVFCYMDVGVAQDVPGPKDPLLFLMDKGAMSRLTARLVTRVHGEPLYLSTDPDLVLKTRRVLDRVIGTKVDGYYALWMLVVWVASGSPQQLAHKVSQVMQSAKVSMSLCMSGDYPTHLVSVTDALLYVIESSRIWCIDHVWRDRLRTLLPAYETFRDVLMLNGHDVSKYDSRVADLRFAKSLRREGDVYEVRKRLCAEFMDVYTYQSGKVVILDGYKRDAKVSLRTAKSIALVCNGFQVPYLDLGIPDVGEVLKIGAVYTSKENEVEYASEDVVTICPLTLRPLTDWKEQAEARRGPMQKQISAHKHALDFYLLHRRFPDVNSREDMDTFIGMLENTYAGRGCLPRGVVGIAHQIFQDMMHAMEQRRACDTSLCDPDTVVQDIKRGYDRPTRKRMECEWLSML